MQDKFTSGLQNCILLILGELETRLDAVLPGSGEPYGEMANRLMVSPMVLKDVADAVGLLSTVTQKCLPVVSDAVGSVEEQMILSAMNQVNGLLLLLLGNHLEEIACSR